MTPSLALLLISASLSLSAANRILDQARGASDGIDQMSAALQAKCPECGTMLFNLFSGISQAGFMKDSEWDLSSNTLTVNLNKEKVYGEVPSASKVPVLFELDETVEVSFDFSNPSRIVAGMNGMHTKGPKQGMDLYKKFTAEHCSNCGQACDAPDFDFIGDAGEWRSWGFANKEKVQRALGCIQDETKAADTYIREWAKTAKESEGKISAVFLPTFGLLQKAAAIGQANLGEIVYAMATITSLNVNQFVFEDLTPPGKGKPQWKVYATTTLHEDEFKQYNEENHIRNKALRLGVVSLLRDGESAVKTATKIAKSGLNFAMLMAFGDDLIRPELSKLGFTAADPVAMARLFAACCEVNGSPTACNPAKGSFPAKHDPKCEKELGRMAWSDEPGHLFV